MSNKMRKPHQIKAEIQKLEQELKESERKIPKMNDNPCYTDLMLAVESLVEDCSLNDKRIKDVSIEEKDAIVLFAVHAFYGDIKLTRRE